VLDGLPPLTATCSQKVTRRALYCALLAHHIRKRR
jgi:hypothetical protein